MKAGAWYNKWGWLINSWLCVLGGIYFFSRGALLGGILFMITAVGVTPIWVCDVKLAEKAERGARSV